MGTRNINYLVADLNIANEVCRVALQDEDFEDVRASVVADDAVMNDNDPDFFDLVTEYASTVFGVSLENLHQSAIYNESANRVAWKVEAV